MKEEWPALAGLIEAAMRGGTPEADNLIRAVWPNAYRIALSVVRNRALAEDAAQEACAVLFRSIRRLRSVEAFNVWFYRIVIRQALGLERRGAVAKVEAQSPSRSELDDAVLRVDMLSALATLTPQQRAAVVLHYYAEMNSREIATALGIQDSSVRFHIMKAKKSLEKALKESSDDYAVVGEPYGAA
jgi:RNA polymerase sigma factor (sigma-70 family)